MKACAVICILSVSGLENQTVWQQATDFSQLKERQWDWFCRGVEEIDPWSKRESQSQMTSSSAVANIFIHCDFAVLLPTVFSDFVWSQLISFNRLFSRPPIHNKSSHDAQQNDYTSRENIHMMWWKTFPSHGDLGQLTLFVCSPNQTIGSIFQQHCARSRGTCSLSCYNPHRPVAAISANSSY